MTALPSPDHDHDACERDVLARAEVVCTRRGVRLTPQRARVLEALIRSHVPASAYEIIDRLAEDGARPAPISVYRALEFLMANGLAHRIESRNAFVACSHAHGDGSTAFLLCESCGAAGEADAEALRVLIGSVAGRAGFTPTASVVEIRGVCAACRAA